MDAIKFGKFLASLRTEKKLTQEELAEKLFIDKRKVSRWECGMSIPDFETIIKLSEILNVTPYEFSICQRLDKEKLSKKVISKFKNIKDFKNYQLKKKIIIILFILLGIFFVLTAIYTIKYYGQVEIYEFRSLDENYVLNGTYIKTNDNSLYNINDVGFSNINEKSKSNLKQCESGIYYNDTRILEFKQKSNIINKGNSNSIDFSYYGKLSINKYVGKDLSFKMICTTNQDQIERHSIKVEFIKKYDNKLF